MPRQMMVLEVNEVPLRIFRHFQKLRPQSHLDQLLRQSTVIETLAQDVDESFLYPSQTWASLNTGAPYATHQIHWYNDPKPAECPMYWRILADHGIRIGAVNTLHSSPAESFAESNRNIRFLIPDCFAEDTYTKPAYFSPFQTLNLKAVSSNSRATSMKAPMTEALLTAVNAPRYGIRLGTMLNGASLVAKILTKQVNRERLRNLQFPLAADIFLRLVKKHQPDLAILFTNHVAANMHRYWYGLFPEDYPQKIYDNGWIDKYKMEILAAIDLFDAYLGRFMKLARETDRVLVLVSSMGQHANQELTPEHREKHSVGFRLEDVKRLVNTLSTSHHAVQVRQAMVPQYPVGFATTEEASRCAADLREAVPGLKGLSLVVDQNENVITLTIEVDPHAEEIVVRGRTCTYKDLGFRRFEVDDHHSGCHCPEGSLIIYNSPTAKAQQASVDYLEYAPAMLAHFGIPRPAYMLEPSFVF